MGIVCKQNVCNARSAFLCFHTYLDEFSNIVYGLRKGG
ncbi:hypothetical protein bwei_1381 [Bacillus mycoides]|nr:hypothetical protein bwei_1381 [Bacillus mycoides]KZE07476.1 hypothetical protein B4117_0629 [Bacillus mycoides]OSX88614.1 hypothetical protein BTJ44_04292 [Bacillus mycoides]OSY06232.1 hypothetical protein S2E19_06195 [Bacillus mycoides]